MKSHAVTLSVETEGKQQMLDLTSRVGAIAAESGVRDGFVGIYSQHTTAAVFVSEYQAALNDDLLAFLSRVVEDGVPYKHNSPDFSDCDRGNAASHLRIFLPLANSTPVLGRFQSVIFAEFDGPRQRTVQVQILGE
jgi:secondary thiamine-phosphate synthase enzyme